MRPGPHPCHPHALHPSGWRPATLSRTSCPQFFCQQSPLGLFDEIPLSLSSFCHFSAPLCREVFPSTPSKSIASTLFAKNTRGGIPGISPSHPATREPSVRRTLAPLNPNRIIGLLH